MDINNFSENSSLLKQLGGTLLQYAALMPGRLFTKEDLKKNINELIDKVFIDNTLKIYK